MLNKKVQLYSKVTISADDNNICFTIVKPEEVNTSERKISTNAPVGKALLNRSLNEEIKVNTPSGTKQFKILSID